MKYKKVVVQAITRDTTTEVGGYTLYLFEEHAKYIVPIAIDEFSAHSLLLAQQKIPSPTPYIHDTLRNIIRTLNGAVVSGHIHSCCAGTYYTSIKIKKRFRNIDVAAKLTDALATVMGEDKPIYISEEIIRYIGIHMTPEMLKEL